MSIEKYANFDRPVIFVTVAIPASGKTTWTKENPVCNNAHSSDQIRRDFEQDGIHWTHKMVFAEMRRRSICDLKAGRSCIYDATSLEPWARKSILKVCPKEAYKVAVVFETPFEVCLERNAKREGVARVPDDVMYKMAKSYTAPSLEEGFDDIVIIPWNPEDERR